MWKKVFCVNQAIVISARLQTMSLDKMLAWGFEGGWMKFVQVSMVFVKYVEIDFASDGSKIVMYIVCLGMLVVMGEK